MTPPPVAGGAPVANLLRRLAKHNGKLSRYTRRKAPLWQRVGFDTYPTLEEAKRRERMLKHNPKMLTLFKNRLSRMAGHPRQVVG